ncbi:DNA-cytosine methyltransferase [Roseomonas mucosa]|uniref:DNA cytosine methyltransferase n=1 Tax=Roseomonas mucosa TaxID=207340 RepID=UPI0024CD69FD|nr:DNA cytosine methyltransferase [Roseomonas mucosa]QDD95638.1 DNA-cytosine methyltransferase [Roseomonas mucosa]
MSGMTAIDLFCGAGGLSEGFRQAGFHVLAGQDIDEVAGETFAATHSEARFLGGPIQKVTSQLLLKTAGLRKGEVDVMVGGPPCQGYSYYNHGRGEHDPRSGLFREYLRLVDGVRPRWIIMENVAGITSIGKGAIVSEIQRGLEGLGYRVMMKLLKAEEYGVPQERRRMFFIATRTQDNIHFPKPTHGPAVKVPYATIWDAISDLPLIENGNSAKEHCLTSDPRSEYQKALRVPNASVIFNHQAQKLSHINLQRLRHIPQGGSWRDIPVDMLPRGMKLARRCDHTKRYGRPRWSDLACTILTKCDPHWGAYFHPEQDRAFTPREAARLQSFPDSFVFHGSRTEQYIQIGNAVPPLLGRAVGRALIEAMSGAKANTGTLLSGDPLQEELLLAS